MENNVFFYLKPRKHIALHQIHKIMLFLASSYDPFKQWCIYPIKMSFYKLLQIYSSKNTFIMSQKISVSNKCCSFDPSINQRILENVGQSYFPQKYSAVQLFSILTIINDGIEWSINNTDNNQMSIDAENSALLHRN